MADRGEKSDFRIIGEEGIIDGEGRRIPQAFIGSSSEPMHPEEGREAFAEALGVPTEALELPEPYGPDPSSPDSPARRAGRTSVGFTKWNSSWDPKAGEDDNPTLL